ncbi:MRS2 [Branchiostoma lanceolatum]|uniref:Magnesium transporter MRS2 homolog, mitochondrial n=1 Tax=Branchiostoma lanceolatum TaxID=7740 RepID=A0A8J9Z2T0_BRALA|nr:MRS2 [Branchiostoma lanceolatum]
MMTSGRVGEGLVVPVGGFVMDMVTLATHFLTVPDFQPKRLNLEPDKKLATSAPIFRAVKFSADGRHTRFDIRKPALCQELGLQVRDLRFQQQTILQPRDTAIIIRMEEIKAIVSPDCVYILDHEEPRDKVLLDELKTQLEEDNSSPVAHLPLEFKGLEAILSYRISSLKKELDVLEPAILQVLTDLVEPSFMSLDRSKLRVLLQYRKSLTEFQTDVKEYVEVLTDILDYDESIEEMCLTDKITNSMSTSKQDHLSHVDEMELLLENCLGRAEDIVNRVAEVKDLIEDSEQIIFMNLDSLQDFIQQATPAVNTSEASGSAADMSSTSGRRYTKTVAAVVQVLDGPPQSPNQHPEGWDTRTLGLPTREMQDLRRWREVASARAADLLASWRPVLPVKSCRPIVADKNLAVTEKRWWNKLRAGKSLRKMGDCGDGNDNHFDCSTRYRDGRKLAGVERRAVERLGMPRTTVEKQYECFGAFSADTRCRAVERDSQGGAHGPYIMHVVFVHVPVVYFCGTFSVDTHGRAIGRDSQDEAHRLNIVHLVEFQRGFEQDGVYQTRPFEEISGVSHRNVMMRLNVQLTMGTFSIALFGMLGTAFGMNLLSSLEEDPRAFWIVTGIMFAGCGLLWRRLLWFLGREVPPTRKWSWKNFKPSK